MQESGRIAISDLLNDTPIKARRRRVNLAQYDRLMEIFEQTDTPSSDVRESLADELQMTKREVQVWFQNRRAKLNREFRQKNRLSNDMSPIDILASAAEYVRSDHDNKRTNYLH